MKISIPQQDLLKNRPLPPEWYKATFKKMETKPSKDQKSTNFIATFELELDGREMEAQWNSKLMAMMEPFIEVITGKKTDVDADGKPIGDLSFDPDEHLNKKCQVKLDNDAFEGRLISKIKAFLPYDAPPPSSATGY